MREFLQKFEKKPLLTASVFSLVFLFALFFLNKMRIFCSTNDEYIISSLLISGEKTNPFINYFLYAAIGYFQRIIPQVNMFNIIQCLLCVFSLIAVNYVLIRHFSSHLGVLFAFGFDILFASVYTVYLQFSHTATLLTSAGLSLLYCAAFSEIVSYKKTIQTVAAFLLTAIGIMWRLEPFIIAFGFFILAVFCRIVKDTWRKNNCVKLSTLFHSFFCKHIRLIVLLVVFALVSALIYFSSVIVKNSDSGFVAYNEYNAARSEVQDYSIAPFDKAADDYLQIGIKSQDDLDMIISHHTDNDFFTLDILKGISRISRENGYGKTINNNIIYQIVNSASVYLPLPALVALSGILLLITIAVLFRFRYRLHILLKILLIVCWLTLAVLTVTKSYRFLSIPLFFYMVFTVFVFNKRHFFHCALFTFAILGLFFVTQISRSFLRVAIAYMLPSIIYLLLLTDFRDLKTDSLFLNDKGMKVFGKTAFVCCCLICCGISSIWLHGFIFSKDNTNKSLLQYISETPNTIYCCDYTMYEYLDPAYRNGIKKPSFPENSILFGDWQTASPCWRQNLDSRNIESLFDEIVSNQGFRLIGTNNDLFIKDFNYKKTMENYLNNHYSNDSQKITLELDRDFDIAQIYRVKIL